METDTVAINEDLQGKSHFQLLYFECTCVQLPNQHFAWCIGNTYGLSDGRTMHCTVQCNKRSRMSQLRFDTLQPKIVFLKGYMFSIDNF